VAVLDTNLGRWVIAAIAVLAIVALLAWARNDPGVGGREPDPPQSTAVVSDAETVPPTT
jgi:hypothetical protein